MIATRHRSRLNLWTVRRNEQDRLAWHLRERASVCGCTRCGDGDRGEELDVLIAICRERIAELNDRICDRSNR